MSKTQYLILKIEGGICTLLILGCIVLGQMNEQMNKSLVATQNDLNRVDQTQTTLRNLVVRIAQASQSDSDLANLLTKHELKVNLNPEVNEKKTP